MISQNPESGEPVRPKRWRWWLHAAAIWLLILWGILSAIPGSAIHGGLPWEDPDPAVPAITFLMAALLLAAMIRAHQTKWADVLKFLALLPVFLILIIFIYSAFQIIREVMNSSDG